MKIKDLPIGAKVKYPGFDYYGKPIVLTKVTHDGHYDAGQTIFAFDRIVCLKAFDAAEPDNTQVDERSEHGNNNYELSNIDQWLNSDINTWFAPKHRHDTPPKKGYVLYNSYDEENGFLFGTDGKFLNNVPATTIITKKHQSDGGSPKKIKRKIFLMSLDEIGLENTDDNVSEGTLFPFFDANEKRKAYPTVEAVEKSEFKSETLNANMPWTYFTRTPVLGRFGKYGAQVYYVRASENTPYWNYANYGNIGIRPALSLSTSMNIGSQDSNGIYEITFNSSPEISGTDTNLGEKNQPFEVQYSVEDKDITDNVTITEHLNNSLIRRITNANNTDQTLKITSELLNSCPLGELNTIKIYAEDEKGAGTYRNYWFKRTNTPPYFVEENTDLGTVTKAPTITFTAKDDDGDKYLKAKVKINQRVVKTYEQLGNGEQVSFTLDWKDFMQLNNSRKHNLWVEVEDSSGALATLKYTFERDTKKIEIVTNTAPLDIKIKLMVFNANIKLGEGATFLQYACNDFGTGNTWEKIKNGVPHEFANKHEGKDVIGYKCELTKGTGQSEIRSIGGSFI